MPCRVGQVAYALEMPVDSKIYNAFHVSLLKKHHNQFPAQQQLPMFDDERHLLFEPVAILDRRTVKKGNRAMATVV
ncbi:Ty3/gypsy retrotransposon protein [Quillaja saponaria]|uniref:Ty3/gypsy retrotransposon protein n=1 Tax=Quillaja saponaria TaxID=32244 RepID=A0AAD7PG31_QUISA|nr:Ty3/gypsy retrotransposon protein [Quillaja saponaria]